MTPPCGHFLHKGCLEVRLQLIAGLFCRTTADSCVHCLRSGFDPATSARSVEPTLSPSRTDQSSQLSACDQPCRLSCDDRRRLIGYGLVAPTDPLSLTHLALALARRTLLTSFMTSLVTCSQRPPRLQIGTLVIHSFVRLFDTMHVFHPFRRHRPVGRLIKSHSELLNSQLKPICRLRRFDR